VRQWIVIHLVGSCDVSGTHRATVHALLPINLLQWISNATLGLSADLKLLSQTHTETKRTICYLFPRFVCRMSSEDGRDVEDKRRSTGQIRLMLSLSSINKGTTTGCVLHSGEDSK